jgi:methyl-accepting chemotaxis protein
MLNKMRIGTRLVFLIAVQTIVVLLIGLTAIAGLNFATNTTSDLNRNVIEQVKLNQLNESISGDLLGVVNRVNRGTQAWQDAAIDLLAAKAVFENNWDEYLEDRNPAKVAEIKKTMGPEVEKVEKAFDRVGELIEFRDQEGMSTFVLKDLDKLVNPMLLDLNERVAEQQIKSEEAFEKTSQANVLFFYASIGVMVFGLLLAVVLGVMIFRSIAKPVARISDTVSKVTEGDFYARTEVKGQDELGKLGQAFDNLLEDKVATLVQIEKDNTELNDSVIGLLQAVSKLSQRDLTVKVPVTEDVTGPVADALNVLTDETSKVLQGVRTISEEVARASAKVKAQSDQVVEVASHEREEVMETASQLAEAARAMNNIAELAENSNRIAENAINATQVALETVNNTVGGINSIREIIHETEKRIKRLGERSQEISRAVNLINSISERTHILALNASMHAASAGEAGKGFAVVADEVQRLAENARDATAQISTLVNNIQVETSDTVSTMNNVITQVVDGSRLAEKAGEEMQRTRESTANLVASVQQIARNSVEQARVSGQLQLRADQIKASTLQTSEQLKQQNQQTNRLVQYAKGLLNAVQVFKLPMVVEQSRSDAIDVEDSDSTELVQQQAS